MWFLSPGTQTKTKFVQVTFRLQYRWGDRWKKEKRRFPSILEKPGFSREPRDFQANIGFSIEPYKFFGFGFPRYIYIIDGCYGIENLPFNFDDIYQ